MEPGNELSTNIKSLVYRTFGSKPMPTHGVTDLELTAAEHELGVQLPQSYRVFLRHFGSRALRGYDLFGLPRDRLGSDIVLRNEMTRADRPPHLVLFAAEMDRRFFYFDTRRRNTCGECPVIVRDRNGTQSEFARSFVHYLVKVADRGSG